MNNDVLNKPKAVVSVTFEIDVDIDPKTVYSKEKWQMEAYNAAYDYIANAKLTDAAAITIKLKQK